MWDEGREGGREGGRGALKGDLPVTKKKREDLRLEVHENQQLQLPLGD